MKKCNEEIVSLRKRFEEYFPGGHSNKRTIPNSMLTIVSHAKGTRVWDMDGREYIDFACALGPNILGYQNPEYISELQGLINTNASGVGAAIGFTENDVVAAEKIIRHVPCAERVKFTTSGTEAVQAAMRIARSYTGRPYVLMFEDHYHGWLDNTIGLEALAMSGSVPLAVPKKNPNGNFGRAPGSEEGTLIIEWNDINALENALSQCGSEVALIIMEVFTGYEGRPPRAGYLERVRELCDHYGIVLCFDEVLTGFRAGLNGAQGVVGVTPDLATLGKAIGGGMPISAVVGKAEVMDALKNTLCPGTYMGHPLCVQGIVTSLGILERDNGAVYKEIERVQGKLMSGLVEIARRRGLPLRTQGFTGFFCTLFGGDPDVVTYSSKDAVSIDKNISLKFWRLMKEQGIIVVSDLWYLNIMHTDKETEIALEAADRVMKVL